MAIKDQVFGKDHRNSLGALRYLAKTYKEAGDDVKEDEINEKIAAIESKK